jgi:hypothetical protein
MKKLSSSFRRRWVKALRSGKYLQARENLVSTVYDYSSCDENEEPIFIGDGYCCLGVAACMLGISDDIMQDNGNGIPNDLSGTDEGKLFPDVLMQNSIGGTLVATLTNMNDSGKYDFNSIADYIESEEFEQKVREFNKNNK